MTELQEDLERRWLMNEQDDMVASNGVESRLDMCQHLDGGQF